MQETTKPVSMLGSFKRDKIDPSTTPLQYPRLEDYSHEARHIEMKLWREFLDSEINSIEEEDRARALAIGYFVLTSERLQNAPHEVKGLISKRFTEASIELYGEPDKAEVENLASRQLTKLKSDIGKPGVDQQRLKGLIDFFEGQLGPDYQEPSREDDEELNWGLNKFEEMLNERYKDVFMVFEEVKDTDEEVPPEKAQELFQEAIDVLKHLDHSWVGWTADIGEDTAASHDSYLKKVFVGKGPKPGNRLIPVFSHEVLVHAQQSVNGSKTGIAMMEHGMPDSLDAQEGLTTFVETAVSGKREQRNSDLYLNIGLALGKLDQDPISRPKMQKIYLDKLIVETQAEGKKVDLNKLENRAWRHVNRIYRGSLGDEHIAVNTKDISYYDGYLKITKFIKKELKAGKNAAELFDYLVSAKFDPTNPRQAEFVNRFRH